MRYLGLVRKQKTRLRERVDGGEGEWSLVDQHGWRPGKDLKPIELPDLSEADPIVDAMSRLI